MALYFQDYMKTPNRKGVGRFAELQPEGLFEDCLTALSDRRGALQGAAMQLSFEPTPLRAGELLARLMADVERGQTGKRLLGGGSCAQGVSGDRLAFACSAADKLGLDRAALDSAVLTSCGKTAGAKYASLWSANICPIRIDHEGMGVQQVFQDDLKDPLYVKTASPVFPNGGVTKANCAEFMLCSIAALFGEEPKGALAKMLACTLGRDIGEALPALLQKGGGVSADAVPLYEVDCLSAAEMLQSLEALSALGVRKERVNLCGDNMSLGGSHVSALASLGTLSLALRGAGGGCGVLIVIGEGQCLALLIESIAEEEGE